MVTTHEKRIRDLERRVLRLEKWQIKIAVYCSIAYLVLSTIIIWLITWSLNRLAEKLLGG